MSCHRRSLAAVLLLAALINWLALPRPAIADDPPVVTDAQLTSVNVTYLGGTATVSARVTDDFGLLNDVFAEIIGSGYSSVALSQGADEWSGTIELPPNFTDSPVIWRIDVRARDTALQDGVAVAGRVQIDAQPAVDDPPTVTNPTVTPRVLQSAGGPVELSVSATDLYGIEQAYAVVTGPDGDTVVVLEAGNGDRFTGVFNAPANPGTAPIRYSVAMTALDWRYQPVTISGGFITMAAEASAPPASPLRVGPASLSFGVVKAGSHAVRTIVLRNLGQRSSAPISGLLTVPRAPFRLLGAGANGLAFTLAGGQSKVFFVEFRPTTNGLCDATVTVRRPGGGSTGHAIRLGGRGVTLTPGPPAQRPR